MNRLLSLIIIFLFSINIFAQEKHALLIGIGDYLEETGWTRCNDSDCSAGRWFQRRALVSDFSLPCLPDFDY